LRTQVNGEVVTLHGEKPPLPLQIVFLGRQLDRLIEKRLAERGLNRTQVMVLVALSRKPGLKALELCPHARVEPANVTRTLQTLERLDLLERRSHPTDGRASLFYLTTSGQEAARSLAVEMETLSSDLFRSMSQEEVDSLEKSLVDLRAAINRQLSAVSDQQAPSCHHDPEDHPGSYERPDHSTRTRQEDNLQYYSELKADS
jgi:DNA-binding MarR family transcriptional regulator